MGLFDKLKGASMNVPSGTIEREDLSNASLMDLVEKVDQYNNEFNAHPTKANYVKLETAMIELANRVPTIPLAKREVFNVYAMRYKNFLDSYKYCLTLGEKGKQLIANYANQISSFCSKMALALNQ